MTDKEKYLIAGAVALAGIGVWWYMNHTTAAAQIVSQPTATPVATTTSGTPTVAPPVATPVTSSGAQATIAAPAVNQSELAALLAWSQKTQNPPLYAQMINGLTASQIDQLYNILTTEWTTGASPTVAQTTFWNQLVGLYPFLRTGGVGCTNLQCN
jgi:hypothetical protein